MGIDRKYKQMGNISRQENKQMENLGRWGIQVDGKYKKTENIRRWET